MSRICKVLTSVSSEAAIIYNVDQYNYIKIEEKNIQRFSEPKTGTPFSTHADFVCLFVCLHIQKELPYNSLTSTGLLQKQSSFDKMGRYLRFGNFLCPGIRNYSAVFNGKV